jgi:hypothetical protein
VPHPNPERPLIEESALAACTVALGTEAAGHEVASCAYDVSVTGDDGFVGQYAVVVARRAASTGVVDSVEPATPPTDPLVGAKPLAGVPSLTIGRDVLSGTLDVQQGAVLVVRTACPADTFIDIEVAATTGSDAVARAVLCDPTGGPAVFADAGEWFSGEAYIWVPASGVYRIDLDPLRFDDRVGQVDVYADPTPAVSRVVGPSDVGLELAGVADTVVYLVTSAADFTLVGAESACVVQVYWTKAFPDPEPYDLERCEHASALSVIQGESATPIVVFSRVSETQTMSISSG